MAVIDDRERMISMNKKYCPVCGNEIEADALFCGECGCNLKEFEAKMSNPQKPESEPSMTPPQQSEPRTEPSRLCCEARKKETGIYYSCLDCCCCVFAFYNFQLPSLHQYHPNHHTRSRKIPICASQLDGFRSVYGSVRFFRRFRQL